MITPANDNRFDCEYYYNQLHAACSTIIEETFKADTKRLHSASHNYISDFSLWISILEGRPEVVIFKGGLREYQFALLALTQGLYRQAFMALRFFLELTLGGVQLSANELELRIWLKGERDNNWSVITDPNEGVLSRKFVGAFNESIAEESSLYLSIAKKVYRECSEFVHGNISTHEILPEMLIFKEAIFTEWHEKAKNIILVLTFVLYARYFSALTKEQRNKLEATVLDILGHISAIRTSFDV